MSYKLTCCGLSQDVLQHNARGHNRHVLIRADITNAAAMRDIFATLTAWTQATISRRKATSIARSMGRATLIQTNVLSGRSRCWRRHGRPPRLSPVRRDGCSHFITYPQTRCSARLVPAIRRSTRPTSYDPRAAPIRRARQLPDHLGAARAPHLWAADPRLGNTANNYGPWHLQKLIPLITLNALSKRLCRCMATARTGAIGSLSRTTWSAPVRVCALGEPGATQTAIGARQPRSNLDVVRAICAELDCRVPILPGARERLIDFVPPDRPGMISATRSIRRARRRRLAGPRRTTSRWVWRGPSSGSSGEPRTGWAGGARRAVCGVQRLGTGRHERHLACWRLRARCPASDDLGGVEAVAAGVPTNRWRMTRRSTCSTLAGIRPYPW